jgi:folate-dependent phosphoribosylglycinamide formyltransferase PurN
MKTASNKKVVLIAQNGLSTNVVFHAVNQAFGIHTVIIEEKEGTGLFLKRRIKKLGYWQVLGQVIFQALMVPILRASSSSQSSSILKQGGYSSKSIGHANIIEVKSVNDHSVNELIASIAPDVVVLNGTRIVSKKLLSAIKCPVINMHTGITPGYRGVHGAYWALAQNDLENCGVTVHLVDAGVDTGEVLYQARIVPDDKDNFTTYPVKQLTAGIPLLLQAINDALENQLKPYKPEGKSAQWYHPTIWKYLFLRLTKAVK